MKIIELVINILLPIALGYLFKKLKVFNQFEINTLRKFVIKVTVPFIIFRNLYKSDFSELNQILPSIIALFLITFFFFLISYNYSKLFIKDEPKKHSFNLSTMFGNYGYLGWGVTFTFYSDPGLTRSVFFTMFFWPVFLIFGFLYIYLAQKKEFSYEIFIKTLLTNALPPLVYAAAGIIFNISSIIIPESIFNVINKFANITIPMILFTIGLNLKFKLDFHKIKIVSMSSFIRVIAGFAIGYITILILSMFTSIDLLTRKVILVESIMPTAAMTPFFSEFIKTDSELISAIITFSTILSLITIPFWYIVIESMF